MAQSGLRIVLMALLSLPASTWAHQDAQQVPAILRDVGFDQRLHAQVPLDLRFRDETDTLVSLRDYMHAKPVLLTLAYYHCPNLCPLVLNGLVRALRGLSLTVGKDFEVLTVSMDPRDTPALAAATKQDYVQRYGRAGAAQGWHFLTGDVHTIARLTQAVGFRFSYDAAQEQYAHASGIVVLTPEGVVSRYFYGIEYAPRDLRWGLIEAAKGTIGTPIDQLLLYCYHYDPRTGRYGLVIMNVLRLGGLTTVAGMVTFMGIMFRRDRRQRVRLRHQDPTG
jgi:protein SCO1/2